MRPDAAPHSHMRRSPHRPNPVSSACTALAAFTWLCSSVCAPWHGLAGRRAAGLHRTQADPHARHQAQQGLHFPTTQTEPARQHRRRGLDSRTESTLGRPWWHLPPREAPTLRATLLPQSELPNERLELRRLHDLADVRIDPRNPLQRRSAVRAALGVLIHNLGHFLGGHDLPRCSRVPWLATRLPPPQEPSTTSACPCPNSAASNCSRSSAEVAPSNPRPQPSASRSLQAPQPVPLSVR